MQQDASQQMPKGFNKNAADIRGSRCVFTVKSQRFEPQEYGDLTQKLCRRHNIRNVVINFPLKKLRILSFVHRQ